MSSWYHPRFCVLALSLSCASSQNARADFLSHKLLRRGTYINGFNHDYLICLLGCFLCNFDGLIVPVNQLHGHHAFHCTGERVRGNGEVEKTNNEKMRKEEKRKAGGEDKGEEIVKLSQLMIDSCNKAAQLDRYRYMALPSLSATLHFHYLFHPPFFIATFCSATSRNTLTQDSL